MPRRTQPERRDNTILEAVLNVQADTSEIKTIQAVQGEQINQIIKHQETLNGKVATQESNGNTLRTAVDLLISKEQSRSKLEWLTIENIVKGIFAIAIAYLLYRAGI